jgi:OmcA/MtrC family decaheme c-type cytochrome
VPNPYNLYRLACKSLPKDEQDISDLKGHYSLQLSQSHGTFPHGNCSPRREKMNRKFLVRSFVPAGFALCLVACSGSDGKNGKSCNVTTDSTGASTLVCEDGTRAPLGSAVIPKYDGGATNCTIVAPDGGAKKIVCPDGTEVVIPSAVVTSSGGATGSSCTVVGNGDGTSTMTCPGLDGGTFTTTIKSALSNFASMSADEIAALDLKATVASITIPTATGKPVVAFKAIDSKSGDAISGLPAAAMRFALLKLVPGAKGSNDAWVSYMAANTTSVASTESAVATPPAVSGVLVDNGDGSYVYTFAKVVTDATNAGTTYDPVATHRFAMQISQSANGLQVFAPVNAVKDFIPSTGADVTGQNDNVDGAACLECHSAFRAKAGGTGAFHGGSRYDIRFCVACHNDQKRFTAIPGTGATPSVDLDATGVVGATGVWTGNAVMVNGEAFVNFPVFIHKLHMGDELTLSGGSYTGITMPYEITYPQDVRNCDKCHRAPAPQAANYATKPTRRACGGCHDGVSFAALAAIPAFRTPHKGGPMVDDTLCATCHPASGAQTIASYGVVDSHVAFDVPNPTATWLGGTNANTNAGYLPAANAQPAKAVQINYQVKSVVRDANKNPSITFRFVTVDGTKTTPVVFNSYVASAGIDGGASPDGGAVSTELMDGFVNSPSVYFAYALPQDGIAAPADFNATASGYIKNIWNGTATGAGAGTMTFDATTGYYTITLTGVVIPNSATMLTGGVGYTYSLSSTPPLTQINLPAFPYGTDPVVKGCIAGKMCGGLIVAAPDVSMVATDATTKKAYTARRPIVSNSTCIKCHEQLGANPSFHAGQRNDAATCAFCHNPNRANGGWSVSSSTFVHGIHGASKRTVPYTWQATCPTGTTFADGTCTTDNADSYAKVTYPGILTNCQQCHLAGTYDFSATASATALPNLLMSTVGVNPSSTTLLAADIGTSPYVTPGTDYGLGYTTSTITTGTKGGVACTTAAPCVCTLAAPCDADPTTLVKSPITAACSACHDSTNEIAHMEQMGGSFYKERVVAETQSEMCMMCHGPGTVAAIADVHK